MRPWQVAARQALAIMCPLLSIDDERFEVGVGAVEPGVGVVDLGNGVVGAHASTSASLEQQEVETLRLRLSDDRILDNSVGKTPVMVLQEHCHKHEGHTPTYSTVGTSAQRGCSSHTVTPPFWPHRPRRISPLIFTPPPLPLGSATI